MTRNNVILSIEDIKKYFAIKKGVLGPAVMLKAVDGVRFDVRKDRVFAIVGESGCGKSTVARLIIKLLPLTEGRILFKGEDISSFSKERLMEFRKSVQIVFQDPFASLNPRMRVIDTLSEPFKIHRLVASKGDLRERVVELLRRVGMDETALSKYPHEFSGGQRQRICIARALSVSPEVIIADEPLSALDVSIQAQILNLLQDLRRQAALSLIFISHDLHVIHYLSDEVAVMYLGRIVEHADTEDLFRMPKHPYTRLLLSSAPKIRGRDKTSEKGRSFSGGIASPIIRHAASEPGDVPSPIAIPSGCPFHPRCAEKFEMCDTAVPELREREGRVVACHLYS
jgi:oligopeptide/dipeptide ABC transporter ATP-binding protein